MSTSSAQSQPVHLAEYPSKFYWGETFQCHHCELATLNPNVALGHLSSLGIHLKLGPCFIEYYSRTLGIIGKNDADIMQSCQTHSLQRALDFQQQEREQEVLESYCLFCRKTQKNRAALFQHMFEEHSLSIGLVDNLVQVDAFLSLLRQKLTAHVCIYCEKTFTSGVVLRKHMRKKKHFRINPDNPDYDRFYMVNYLEHVPDRNQDEDLDIQENEFEDWTEVRDDCEHVTECLFDPLLFPCPQDAIAHMKEAHSLDLDLGIDFYDRIRWINYVRRCTFSNTCSYCEAVFEDNDSLVSHIQSQSHALLPPRDQAFWEDPLFLFPTLENDPLLMVDFTSELN